MSGRFILASQSPRRRELLDRLGIPFVCVPAEFEERCDPTLPPQLAVSELARHKAAAVRRRCGQNDWVLAADTMVVCGGRMLGKPANTEQARQMLRSLSGAWHEVMTGLALIAPSGRLWQGVEITRVHVLAMDDRAIDAYIATGEPMDKAGAYGIQGGAAAYIDRIEGSYDNVVGLPLARLRAMLAEAESKEANEVDQSAAQ